MATKTLPKKPRSERNGGATDAREFRRLAATWKRETKYFSSIAKKAMHPAYQRIIGMGAPAVPFILRELAKDQADWFWALTAITGANPIPKESAGKVAEMAAAWLSWGREQGLLA